MKFSSSLLDALIGGPCVADCFLLPPLMAQPPTNKVERVAIESWTHPRQPLNSAIELHAAQWCSSFSSSRGIHHARRAIAYHMRADLLAEEGVVDDHVCGDSIVMWEVVDVAGDGMERSLALE